MIRIFAMTPLVALLLLLGGPADAASPTAPLGSHLHYRPVEWHGDAGHPDGPFAGVSVEVPQDWTFALTADKQGRFSDPTRTWLLTVQWPEDRRTVRAEVREQVRALQGTSGLRILRASVVDSRHRTQSRGVLVYRYVDSAGQNRWVKYRYDGSADDVTDIIAVAGRPEDRAGLNAVLHHAVRTLGEAG